MLWNAFRRGYGKMGERRARKQVAIAGDAPTFPPRRNGATEDLPTWFCIAEPFQRMRSG